MEMVTFLINWEKESIEELNVCISSINAQPKSKYEIIVIDNLGENRAEIINDIKSQIKIYYFLFDNTSWKNILENVREKINGNYIQIVDAMDQINIDWCYEIGKYSDADIIIGYQFYINKDKILEFNLSPSKGFDLTTTKAEILRVYYNHGGEDRYLTEINNKVISKNLFFNAMNEEELLQVPEEFYLCGMNAVCLTMADKIVCVSDTSYIYNMAKETRIYTEKYDEVIEKYSKYLCNLKELILYNEIELNDSWEKDWYRELINRLYLYNSSELINIIKATQNLTGENFNPLNTTSYFEKLTTQMEYSYEYHLEIKKHIASDECKYVGFDIFDTLIERPFWEPTDLFYLLNKEFNRLIGKKTSIDFSLIRRQGEQGCRAYYIAIRPSNEDVTIDEIYDFISEKYGIAKDITDALKKYEISLEIKYCKDRKIGRELFDWAKHCGKKIYVISDMYLSKETIEKILEKNGYSEYQKLYLSNDIGISKYSGNLFDYFLKDANIEEPSYVCFIGDNYGVDFVNSKRYGIVPFHVPKAVEVFQGMNSAIYAGETYKNIYEPNGGIIDQGTVLKFIGIRSMMAVVANKFFGNPFVTFNRTSDFNADGRYIGYYLVGMFLLSESQWLCYESIINQIDTIHFVSRDGYLVKEAFDKLKKVYDDGATSNYLYFSRKAVAPLYMSEPEGIYELFLPPHILSNTPDNVVKMLSKVVKEDVDVERILKDNNIIQFKKFRTLNEFYIFAKVFTEQLYDKNKAKEYRNLLYEYFSGIIKEGDVIFDVGYSGRMETALSKLLGFPVNSYYFHEHEPWALMRKENMNFSIDSFYSFKPCSAFVLREQIFTPNQASCVGFVRDGDIVRPEFGKYKAAYKEEYVLGLIQKWALAFVDDMVNIFGDDLRQLVYNRFDACIPFEYYMHYAKNFDRLIMSAVDFEDEFGTNKVLSLFDYWSEEQRNYRLMNDKKVETPVIISVDKNQLREEIYREEGIFSDGVFIKFYRKLNQIFPLGSKRRNFVKKIVGLFSR